MSEELKNKLNAIGVNQAGAYDVAIEIYRLREQRRGGTEDLSFIDWCNYMYEDAPYDEYE